MEELKNIAKLKRAIDQENVEALQRIERYEALTAKLLASQQGTGPEPTPEEFDQWRTDVETCIAIKLLHNGLTTFPAFSDSRVASR
ncbi:MAG: hypothetical protein ABIQ90_01475 [Polaromonas sp.]